MAAGGGKSEGLRKACGTDEGALFSLSLSVYMYVIYIHIYLHI